MFLKWVIFVKFIFINADYLTLISQDSNFEEAQTNFAMALNALSQYYEENSFKLNPSKTEPCAFQIHNRPVGRALNIMWRGVATAHNHNFKYLSTELGRYTYGKNCEVSKEGVCSQQLTPASHYDQMGC